MQRAALVGLVLLGAAGTAASQSPDLAERPARSSAYSAVGYASWYGREFHGHRTADGEMFDMGGLTAAHRTMPLPCYARVTNLGNGRSILVRVNDRGPFVGERLIDVSAHVADLLDFRRTGLTKVKVDYVGMAPPGGGDGPALLASLKTRDSTEDGVSAYAPTPKHTAFAASGALAAANQIAMGPPRALIVDSAYPPRDDPPRSPYGDLVPSVYGEIPPWPAEPSASPSLMAELRR